MSYMTSAALPRTAPLPTLRVSIPMMQTQDGAALFPLKTRTDTPPPATATNPHIHNLFSMFPQQRYFIKKASRAKDKDTRSKARPGFRKGKWTDEESKFAEQMAHYFKEGLLPLEKGTMLRMYLADKLNCEPMRITKKFTGDECIGKQIFRPLPPSPQVEQRIQEALAELEVLEKAFLERIEEMPMYCMSTKKPNTAAKRPKKSPKAAMDNQRGQDTQAASLLLGFFNQAHTDEDTSSSSQDTPETPSSTEEVVYRSKRKFSISHCVNEAYMQRPRIDSFSLVTFN